jgi:type VI secretion system protein VasD
VHRFPLTRITCTVLVAVALLGCGGGDPPKPEPPKPEPPKPEPTRLELTLAAAPDVNPDVRGSPSLIVARLYVLSAQSAFAGADFFAIHDQEQAVLATDLLSRNEVVLQPGQSTTLKSKVDDHAKFIGVVAGYQNMNRATWRAVAPLLEGQTNAFRVELARQTVSLERLPEGDDGKDEKEKEKNDRPR